MNTLALLIGIWSTTCLQTQINGIKGFVIESYEFSQTSEYEFSREWFRDANCTEAAHKDVEHGTLRLGQRMSGMFISGKTYEADFKSDGLTDLGAIAINSEDSIKVARGIKGQLFRNSMVGIFDYKRK